MRYSSSTMLTTCSDKRIAVLQDVGTILSGIEGNNHIFYGFLSLSYPWDKNTLELIYYANKCILCHYKRYIELIGPFFNCIFNVVQNPYRQFKQNINRFYEFSVIHIISME